VVPVALLAGCGGKQSAPQPRTTFVFKAVSAATAATCLNSDQFLVQPGEKSVRGSSPEGVNFTVKFYETSRAANAAYARVGRRFGAKYATAVVNFAGNPPPHPGAPPRVLKDIDLATIRHCVIRVSTVTTGG
jgi:hypothetical protein